VKRAVLGGAVGAAFVLCWMGAGIRPAALVDPANARAVGAFARGLFPPDVSPAFLRVVGEATVRTLGISIAGTVLSAILGLLLGHPRSPRACGGEARWSTRTGPASPAR